MLTNRWTPLRYHAGQHAYMNSPTRFNVLPCGRRCLEEGTLVATPQGPRAIETLKIGDEVLGFEKDKVVITTVANVFDNGRQLVYPYGLGEQTYLAATENHKLWVSHETCENYERKELCNIQRWHKARRAYAGELITGGPEKEHCAYSLGALLADGYCRNDLKQYDNAPALYFDAKCEQVAAKIADQLGSEYYLYHKHNHTWRIIDGHCRLPHYEWLNLKFEHEKICQWDIINTWDRLSCLEFLAGVFDVIGLIDFTGLDNKQLRIELSTQCLYLLDACQRIIFKYFQEKPNVRADTKKPYVNAQFYTLSIKDTLLALRVMLALAPHMTRKFNLEDITPRNSAWRMGLKQVRNEYEANTFDITVDNSTNLYCLHAGGIVTSNSGKTERAKRKLVIKALEAMQAIQQKKWKWHNARFFAAAPTFAQAKRIYWQDLKALIPKQFLAGKPKESDLIIPLKNDVEIHVLGMDKPERFEGSPWNGGILDEYGNMRAEAWAANIRPGLSDRQGWCDMIGVPEGRNHYYDLYKEALADKSGEWSVFSWPSSDILDPAEIESARRQLDELTFMQEYEASFVSFSGRAYYNFQETLHTSLALSYNPHAPLVFCFDFNVSPGVAVVLQEQVLPGLFDKVPNPRHFRGPSALAQALKSGLQDAFIRRPITGTGVIGEVYIPQNSTTPAVCRKLINDWHEHKGEIYCYGDASGGAQGSAKTMGSDWELIDQTLSGHYGNRVSLFVPSHNPSERARVNAVNSRLKSADGIISMLIDPEKCPYLIKDLEGVRVLEGGSGEIDKKKDKKLTHISDALGYYIVYEFPVQADNELMEFPTANRY